MEPTPQPQPTEPQRAGQAAAIRVRLARSCLVVVGVAATLSGTAVAEVANLPGGGVNEYARTGRRDDADSWLGWLAVGMVLACLVWAIILWSTRPTAWAGAVRRRCWIRVAASVVLAAGGAVGLVVAVDRMPAPGPLGGPDLSFPLTTLGLAMAALGGLAVAVGNLPRLVGEPGDRATPSDRARWGFGGGSFVAVALLTVALAVQVVPAWAVAVNTEATTTDQPGPGERVPALDGTVAWSTPTGGTAARNEFESGAHAVRRALAFDPARESVMGTDGGVAVLEARGLRMLDPATGDERWSYRRWDVRHFGPRHRRNGADVGSAAVSPDGRWLAMTVFVDARRALFVDDRRARTRIWAFDTVSGQLRADLPVPDAAVIVAFDRHRLLATVPAPSENDTSRRADGRALAMIGLDGAVRWRYNPGAGCRPGQVVPVEDDLLTLVSCGNDPQGNADDRHRLVRVGGGTGEPCWSWQIDQYGADPAEHGYERRLQRVSVAVTARMAVADVRVILQREVGLTTKGTVWHNLVGVRLADGKRVWQRPDLHYGEPSVNEAAVVGPLHAAASTVMFAEHHHSGKGRAARYSLALRAFDVATGAASWSIDVPDAARVNLAASPGPIALLRDGRLLLAYGEATASDRPARCTVAVWEAATGRPQSEIRPRAVPDDLWCDVGRLDLVEVPGGVAVSADRLFVLG